MGLTKDVSKCDTCASQSRRSQKILLVRLFNSYVGTESRFKLKGGQSIN